jgi:hypothetical protein
MSPAEDRHPVRSYARLFRPDRRLYAIEGHRLPIPGGVPLRWLGWAAAGLLAVLALSSRAVVLALLLAGLMAAVAASCGSDRATTLAAASGTAGGAQVVGYLLATLGWPIRLLVVPAALATIATQATPDGRPAARYAWSWLLLQLRPVRRTLGRPAGVDADALTAGVPVAPDHHGALRRARIVGPARVRFTVPVTLRQRRRGRLIARPTDTTTDASAEAAALELAAGARLEVRR